MGKKGILFLCLAVLLLLACCEPEPGPQGDDGTKPYCIMRLIERTPDYTRYSCFNGVFWVYDLIILPTGYAVVTK